MLNSTNITNRDATSAIDRQFWEYFDSEDRRNVSWEEVVRQPGIVLEAYWALLVVGAAGNLAVLAALARSRRRRSRVDLLMRHLAVADVCVTCVVIPLEIGWKYTNAWLVGNLLCKILLVMRAFGLYLSSNILVCISVDRRKRLSDLFHVAGIIYFLSGISARFFAVLYPLKLSVARRRIKQMLYAAWTIALCCSLPQSAVFRVKQHPYVFGFEQCVSFDAFSTIRLEVAYNVFCLCAMYFIPLVIITVCYVCIFFQIRRSSTEINGEYTGHCTSGLSSVRLRRSDGGRLQRARRRTLRMTVVIVTVFALCWLPYATMAMWYMVDRESASRVSPQVQDVLFAMAVSNSCMNPLVYGSYALSFTGVIERIFKSICCRSSTTSETVGFSGSTSLKNRNLTPDTCLTKSVKNGRVKPRLGVRFAEPLPDADTCKSRGRTSA